MSDDVYLKEFFRSCMRPEDDERLRACKAMLGARRGAQDSLVLECAESPIESLFLTGLLMTEWVDGQEHCNWAAIESYEMNMGACRALMGRHLLEMRKILIHSRTGALMFCQASVEVGGRKMRVDALAVCRNKAWAIELDGHDFHERTKAQATRDKSRDRALQALGWGVLRYTGSEIWSSPAASVIELNNIILAHAKDAKESHQPAPEMAPS